MPNETAPNELGEVAVGANDNPYPDRIENVEKAHEMALAGDELMTLAAADRAEAPRHAEHRAEEYNMRAEAYDEGASKLEDKAGVAYDQRKAEETRIKDVDVDMAETMAHAEDPLQSMAQRLEKSGNPEDMELAKTLREEGDELAEKAKQDFEQEKERFEQEKRRLIGWVLATTKGEMSFVSGRTDLLTTTPELGGDMYYDQPIGLSTAHKEQLCKVVYDLLGAKEPTKKDVDRAWDKRGVYGGPSAVVALEAESPDTGLKIIDQRVVEPHGLMRRITENGRMLSIQRIDR